MPLHPRCGPSLVSFFAMDENREHTTGATLEVADATIAAMIAEPVPAETAPPADYDPPAGVAKRAKRLSLAMARSAGAFGILKSSRWRRRRLLVLAYHGISLNDEHLWNCKL